ncbi:glutathionylspermidine synthase family protein [Acetivibrio clariflavus]|uniref:Glutathionylspermidine synthase n=1 Tax=Acetivibrio clariflavus (strain DSM 19732 / NBRC 101661 / EBR45) TaxID=720554 RepID=G8LXF5_ACECE|nr:glutathionylspermidine synthase family protein [Acetivibrio clariflavus]AEV69873.1 glutathionylspermidine synthase [Acetivibrio clariflavus DSM 19732]
MKNGIELASIPNEQYSEYRYNVIFKAYKWDPQVGDHNTIAKHAVLMEQETARQLETWAEQLSAETMQMEEALIHRQELAKKLSLPRKIIKNLFRLSSYERNQNIRLMRFDFHPTTDGWAISEVNSDVPGGLAEASVLPKIACQYFPGYEPHRHVGDSIFQAFSEKVKRNGVIALVHATSYSDDRQVMEFLSDYFQAYGYGTVFAAPDHIAWKDNKAICIIEGKEGFIDGIVRFFPLEWLPNLPRRANWQGYFDCLTPSCNHPVAIFTQSKRLPLVWDELGVDVSTWKKLLPETRDPKSIKKQDNDWIYKPALGRVGEGISIREAITEKELKIIEKIAHRGHGSWIAQRKFASQPLTDINGETFHLCVGVFTVDGKSAGFYGRISPYPRIDDRAKDIPILVSKGGKTIEG